MDYTTQIANDEFNVALKGQFTYADNQKFKAIIDSMQKGGIRQINLNFAQVDFIDSAGLGMMLLLRDLCQNRHIPISIQSAGGQVERIFMISKFDQLFTFRS